MKKIRRVLNILVGGAVVYTACSVSARRGSYGDAGPVTDGGTWDSVVDAISDGLGLTDQPSPVPDAKAASPVIVSAQCSLEVDAGNGTTYHFAEAEFPGRTVEELGRAYSVVKIANVNVPGNPPGYTHTGPGNAYLAPGKVAVGCGVTSSGQTTIYYSDIKVILPTS